MPHVQAEQAGRQVASLAMSNSANLCVAVCVRYERTANDMLAKSTIAGQEGVITYLANAAALQQFEQTALAYVLMHEAGQSVGASGLAAAAESLLEGKFEVGIPLSVCHIYEPVSRGVYGLRQQSGVD